MRHFTFVQGTGDPATLATAGMFLHTDSHKRSWVCQEVGANQNDEEGHLKFAHGAQSAGGLLNGRIATCHANSTAEFLAGFDWESPTEIVKKSITERDEFISETKHICKVNNTYDAVAVVVQRLYNDRLPLWYGRLEVACSQEESVEEFKQSCVLKIAFEDGSERLACLLWGRYHRVSVDGSQMGSEAGDHCECYFVGTEPLQ